MWSYDLIPFTFRLYKILIDLHIHSFFSDGQLCISEIARRAEEKGYKAIAVTDHADRSNIDFIIESLVPAAAELNKYTEIKVIVGIELTHVPPKLIAEMIEYARAKGAQIVGVHGETIVEPVAAGTNLAAIYGGADFLAHPGFLTKEEAEVATEKGVFVEITTRAGHSYTNGHVVNIARAAKSKMIINNDTHNPSDLLEEKMLKSVARGAGLSEKEIEICFRNSLELFESKLEIRNWKLEIGN